jgi:hypothetical protein
MNDQEQALLTLIVPPALRNQIIDHLLQFEEQGFLSLPVAGHSTNHERLNLAEQIAGREQRLMLQAHGKPDELQAVLASLVAAFSDAPIHYWIAPLLQAGRLQNVTPTQENGDLDD